MANEIVVLKLSLGTDGKIEGVEKIESTAKKAGEKSGEKFNDGFSSSMAGFAKVALKVGALLTGALGAISFAKAIKNAQVQEDAINALNNSLAITGRYTKQASQDFQDFASELQKNSKFGDEVILKNAALIQSLAKLDSDGLKRATKASADFAAALNVDIDTASRIVGKALEGNIGALKRYGIEVQAGATKAETLGNVLSTLEARFGGSAKNQINTFSGALAQSSNAFGDLLEEIGFLITKQPLVVEFIKTMTGLFVKAGESVKGFAKTFSLFYDVIKPLLIFSDAVIKFVIAPIEMIANAVNFTVDKVIEGVFALVAVVGQAGGLLASGLEKFGIKNKLIGDLKSFEEQSNQIFISSANQAQKSFQSILDFPFSAGLAEKNQEVLAQVEALNASLSASSAVVKNNVQASTDAVNASFYQLDLGFQSFKLSFDNSAKTIAQTGQQLAQQLKAGMVSGISGGIQNIISSLANGQNAFKNFGKFFLQTIGDLAIQFGQTLIGAGIGIEALKSLGGGAAIAAGAGLVALGAIVKSLAGGGGASSPAPTGSARASDDFTSVQTPLSEPDDIERRPTGPSVQLVVQGDILDSEQTGNRLLDILNKNFSDKGGSFNGASFA